MKKTLYFTVRVDMEGVFEVPDEDADLQGVIEEQLEIPFNADQFTIKDSSDGITMYRDSLYVEPDSITAS